MDRNRNSRDAFFTLSLYFQLIGYQVAAAKYPAGQCRIYFHLNKNPKAYRY